MKFCQVFYSCLCPIHAKLLISSFRNLTELNSFTQSLPLFLTMNVVDFVYIEDKKIENSSALLLSISSEKFL